MKTADAMSATLKQFGYEYVNMDDCWARSRMANGTVVPDPVDFPNGIKYVADYVHSLGLKFGLYSDAGTATCDNRPGSLGYEKIDAMTYASWGVDYLKYDNCNSGSQPPEERYPIMRDALNATGRPIFFSMCEWGVDNPASWAPEVGNSWRTTGDIADNWQSMISNLDNNALVVSVGAPGGWNDPDMLEIGNGGLTYNEEVSHFSLWAIIKAPLIVGNDLTNMSDTTLSILNNTEVIAVSQDPLGIPGRRILIAADDDVNAGLQMEPCSDSLSQKWSVHNTDSTIRSLLSGSCLDVSDCSTADGPVGTFPCHIGEPNAPCNSANQQWTFTSDGFITNVGTGKCLNVWNNQGPAVWQFECSTGSNNEVWNYNASTGQLSTPENTGCLAVQNSTAEVWVAPLSDGSFAVVLFNRQDEYAAVLSAQWSDIGIPVTQKAHVRDLWAHEDLGPYLGKYTATVHAHGVVMLKITPI